MAEGAAALYLEKGESAEVELAQIAGPELITARQPKALAAKRVRDAVVASWPDWDGDSIDVRDVFGEGLGASAGWQCVAAAERARRGHSPAVVNVTGLNEHCAAAVFCPA
jgi:hypothetical protein